MGRHTTYKHETEETFLHAAAEQVEVLNAALGGISSGRMRLHICRGNYEGPHTRDIGLYKVVHLLLQVRPDILLFEAANPRRAHEWRVLQAVGLPPEKVLCPGVIDSTSNYVEHSELVAWRLQKLVSKLAFELSSQSLPSCYVRTPMPGCLLESSATEARDWWPGWS